MKKSAKQKLFRLASDKRKPDPLVHKRVAFDINDNGYGQELLNHFGGIEKVSSSLSNGTYLFVVGVLQRRGERRGVGTSLLAAVGLVDAAAVAVATGEVVLVLLE